MAGLNICIYTGLLYVDAYMVMPFMLKL